MTIEEEIFKKTKIDFDKVTKYGFKKEKNLYKYSKNIMDNAFKVDIEIDNKGVVKGKIYDLSFGDEYTNFRIEDFTGSFVGNVREEFRNILKDIRDKCFVTEFFLYEQTNRIANLIREKYGDEPEFQWDKLPGYATFRNKDSKKWYGLIANIDINKIDKTSSGEVEIINIKLDTNKIQKLLKQDGFYPAYHMNKKSWITIILNDTITDKNIMKLIDESYLHTVKNKSNNEWIIPANPKYFDIEKALNKSSTMIWKQSTDIKINDIIYLYVAQPYSSIMYKFKVVEADISYKYKDENIKIQKAMKMDLLTKYEKGKYSFNKLKEFGINAVRGPRYMPIELSKYINKVV